LSKRFCKCLKNLDIFGDILHKKDEKQEKENNVKELEKRVSEQKDSLMRLQAEFENFQKRNEKEKIEYLKIVNAGLLKDFLPLVDSISEAVKQGAKHENKEMVQGLELIEEQLIKILEKNGVKFIETEGKSFDFNLHECMMTAHEKGKKEGEILEEFQKGYLINGRVLRPAKVKVNKIEEKE